MVGVADVLHRSVGVVQVGLDDEGVDPLLQREGRRPSVEDGEEDPFLRVDVLAIGDVGEELDALDRTVVGQDEADGKLREQLPAVRFAGGRAEAQERKQE